MGDGAEFLDIVISVGGGLRVVHGNTIFTIFLNEMQAEVQPKVLFVELFLAGTAELI